MTLQREKLKMDIEKFRTLSPSERIRFMQVQKELVTKENCVGFTPNDWSRLTLSYPECLDWWYTPGVKLRGFYAAWLYAEHPELVDAEVFKTFLPRDWVLLLERQPQFADVCDFSKFTADEGASLLGERSEFLEKCCVSDFKGKDRKKIVLAAPILADKTDFDGFSPYEWTCVLKKYPDLGNYYNWKELAVECRVRILSRLPDFADKMYVEDFSGYDWYEVLSSQPGLERVCDFSKLSGSDWVSLVQCRSEFAQRCDWSTLTGDDWTVLLKKDETKKYCRYCDFGKLSIENWDELLQKYPEWHARCPNLESLCPQATKEILKRNEEIASLLNLIKLSAPDWVEILADRPECCDICDETFGVENFSVRQLLYLRHCMEAFADEDDILREEYKELSEWYGGIIEGKDSSRTFDPDDWKMDFYVSNVVPFEGRRYKLCELVKPDYYQGFGFALAYPLDEKENDLGFIRCVRLKFTPSSTVAVTSVACGLEESNEWYCP